MMSPDTPDSVSGKPLEPMLVILAAGGSRRMGQAKPLLKFAGRSLLRRAVEEGLAANLEVMVILGCEARVCAQEIQDLPAQIVINAQWQHGMGHSIAVAAKAVQQRGAAPLLLSLVDQPAVGASQFRALIARQQDTGAAVCLADYGLGQMGPPALFAPHLLPALAGLTGDQGARAVVQANRQQTVCVAMHEAALDLDTPEDITRWSRQ